jgi:hypothetical protein
MIKYLCKWHIALLQLKFCNDELGGVLAKRQRVRGDPTVDRQAVREQICDSTG